MNMVIGATSGVSCVVLFDFLYKYTTDTPSKRTIVNAYIQQRFSERGVIGSLRESTLILARMMCREITARINSVILVESKAMLKSPWGTQIFWRYGCTAEVLMTT